MSRKRIVLSEEFFENGYPSNDRLSRAAAYEVCLRAIDRSALVSRVEGGVWQDPGFMARTSCIWNAFDIEQWSLEQIQESNSDAANFIAQADMEIDTFILSFFVLEGAK